jgi:hypothetical protein
MKEPWLVEGRLRQEWYVYYSFVTLMRFKYFKAPALKENGRYVKSED